MTARVKPGVGLQRDEARSSRREPGSSGRSVLLEQALTRENLQAALSRVKRNAGSAGVDGMTVKELSPFLREHWPRVKGELLDGSYRPSPVRRHAIPKPGGGERELGIPTVLDRFIQQALLQVLQPLIDPTFSEASYGFRPGRRAHDAIIRAQGHVQAGFGIVVDVDLEKFFDRVNHDILMGRLARRIADPRVLRLIRRYLDAGIMVHGVVNERHAGTPQGGPLSPLLANVLLDEVDRALERSGHRFVRYADDCNVYVRSQRAGGAHPSTDAVQPGSEHRPGGGRIEGVPAGLEGLLPPGADAARLPGTGRMAAAPAAHAAPEALAAREDDVPGACRPGCIA